MRADLQRSEAMWASGLPCCGNPFVNGRFCESQQPRSWMTEEKLGRAGESTGTAVGGILWDAPPLKTTCPWVLGVRFL